MDDRFSAIAAPTFKHDCILEDDGLDLLWKRVGALSWFQELSCKVLEYDVRGDALREQLV